MFLFSLGTVPLMLGLGSIVSALGKQFARAVMNVGAVLVTVLGLAMLSQGGSLSGLLQPEQLFVLIVLLCVLGVAASIPFRTETYRLASLTVVVCIAAYMVVSWSDGGTTLGGNTAAADSAGQTELVDGVQVVASTLTTGRYPDITVRAGTPVKWVIDAPAGSINGCNYRMILRDFGVTHEFQEGENVIEFTPTRAGTYQYSCWMGMIHGNIFVTDGDGAASAGDDSADVPVPAEYQIPSDELAVAEMTVDAYGETIQQVTIELTESGFRPAVVVVQQDVPAFWTIRNSLTADGSAWLLVPYYSTILDLVQGDNPLSLYPSESFEVSTGDNAFYAYVKVVEDLSQFDAAAVRAEVDQFETIIYPAEVFSAYGAGASCCG